MGMSDVNLSRNYTLSAQETGMRPLNRPKVRANYPWPEILSDIAVKRKTFRLDFYGATKNNRLNGWRSRRRFLLRAKILTQLEFDTRKLSRLSLSDLE